MDTLSGSTSGRAWKIGSPSDRSEAEGEIERPFVIIGAGVGLFDSTKAAKSTPESLLPFTIPLAWNGATSICGISAAAAWAGCWCCSAAIAKIYID